MAARDGGSRRERASDRDVAEDGQEDRDPEVGRAHAALQVREEEEEGKGRVSFHAAGLSRAGTHDNGGGRRREDDGDEDEEDCREGGSVREELEEQKGREDGLSDVRTMLCGCRGEYSQSR